MVIGHSLGEDVDQHIVDAIAAHQGRMVAIGVRRGMTDAVTITKKAGFIERLRGVRIDFFDATTHPLTDPDLHCEEQQPTFSLERQ